MSVTTAAADAQDRRSTLRAGMASAMGVGNSSGKQNFSSILFCSSSVASAQVDRPEIKHTQ
eukprot:3985285-Karenia_brevis.AAC.1